MKFLLDQKALLITGLICAFLAWCFWYFLGQNAFDVFALLFMFTLLAENHLLKKELRKLNSEDRQEASESA